MPARSRFPDTEAMASKAMIAAGVCGGRVYSSIPNNPTFPLVILTRVGGLPSVERRLDSASLQIDVYGNNKSEARAAADSARLALHSSEGTTWTAEGGFISGVEDSLGLSFQPDPEIKRDRYIFGVIVHSHTTFTT